jgi:hypothetical protein
MESMRKLERVAWLVVVVALVAFVFGLRGAWLRDRAQWQSTLAAATAAPVVVVKYSDRNGGTMARPAGCATVATYGRVSTARR